MQRNRIIRIVGAIIFVPLLFLATCYVIVIPSGKYVYSLHDQNDIQKAHAPVGIVLGSLIDKQGRPQRQLTARLNIAADALTKGYIDDLILSGDNRYMDYNEPLAMQNYLVNVRHISQTKLHMDNAGRSTYESCERASKIFAIKQAILFSSESHLPRAIYLCRHFGIETYGVHPDMLINSSPAWREVVARAKAVLNIYVYGERTVLGKPMPINGAMVR